MTTFHTAQATTLYALRHTRTARFSELMKASGLESDVFKFHIRKLVQQGYIEKTAEGAYQLTTYGKETANNLDMQGTDTQKQPKLSVLLIVKRVTSEKTVEYLVQQRARSPYFDYIGCLSGPIQWAKRIEETASSELLKQTGLTADFNVQGMLRQQDYTPNNHLLEDKLFVIVTADAVQGAMHVYWKGNKNSWMTLDALVTKPKYFRTSYTAIEMLQQRLTYTTASTRYAPEDY